MQIYRIGPAKGAQRAGFTRDANTVLARMQAGAAEPLLVKTWDHEAGRAMLVDRIVRERLDNRAIGDGWFNVSPAFLDGAIEAALASTSDAFMEEVATQAPTPAHYGNAVFVIRTKILQTTQSEIGRIVGRSGAIVSRWEAGTIAPGLDVLLRLRSYCKAVGLPFDDALLLEPPLAELPTEQAMETA